MQVLETERLIIRHFEAEDLEEFFAICRDPEIMRFVGNNQPLSREQTRQWIAKSQENYRAHGLGTYAVVARQDNCLIGYCGLVLPTFGEQPEAEIIYGFRKECWGRGLASEAARAMLDFGSEQAGLRRIIATVDPENHASIHILEKLGMKYEQQRVDEHGLPEIVYTLETAGL